MNYEDLVEKLASEIIEEAVSDDFYEDDADMDVEASVDEYMQEKIAAKLNFGGAADAVKKGVGKYMDTVKGKGVKAADYAPSLRKRYIEEAAKGGAPYNAKELLKNYNKGINAARAKQVGAIAAPVAGVAGGTAAAVAMAKKKKAQEKAAAYYEEAQMLKQAAEEAFAEASAIEDASIEALGELGFFDEE